MTVARMLIHEVKVKYLTCDDSTYPMTRHTRWLDIPDDSTYPMTRHTRWLDIPHDSTYPMTRHTRWLDIPHDSTYPMTRHTPWLDIPHDSIKSAGPQALRVIAIGLYFKCIEIPNRNCGLGVVSDSQPINTRLQPHKEWQQSATISSIH
jgi:hypothetical protein